MRGLSLTQPYASLVAAGSKAIETRSWRTDYRGPVAIHAAKTMSSWARFMCGTTTFQAGLWGKELDAADLTPAINRLPLGAIVAVARLDNCVSTNERSRMPRPSIKDAFELVFGDYSPDRFAWFLADVRALPEPIPCKGALGLWTIPDDVLDRITAQLGATV